MADNVGDIVSQIIAESKNYVAGLRTATASLAEWGSVVGSAFTGIEKAVAQFSSNMDRAFGGVDQTLEIFRLATSDTLKGIQGSFKDLKTNTGTALAAMEKSAVGFAVTTNAAFGDVSTVMKKVGAAAAAPVKAFKDLATNTDTALKGVTKSTQQFHTSTESALKGLEGDLKSFAKATKVNLDAVKVKQRETADAGESNLNRLGGSFLNLKNVILAAVTAIVTSRLISWIGDLINKSEELEAAQRGLKAAASITGQSFDDLSAAAKEVSGAGLLSFEEAAKGLKNFALMGLTVDQAKQALVRFTEQTLLFGSSRKALGSNVLQATDAFRLQNDELLKNIGLTEGFSGLMAKAGVTQEDMANKTNKANTATAIFNVLMRDTAASAGLAAQASEGWNGEAGKLTVGLDSLKAKLGEIIQGGLLEFLNHINPIIIKVTEWLETNKQILAQDLAAHLKEWSDAFGSFSKGLNSASIQAVAFDLAALGERGKVAFNVLAIPVYTLVSLLQWVVTGVQSVAYWFKTIAGTAGVMFDGFAAAVKGDFFAAKDAIIAGLDRVNEKNKGLEDKILAMGTAASESFAKIGTGITGVSNASDKALAFEQRAADARLRAAALNVTAKEQEVKAIEEVSAADKEAADYMDIVRTQGLEKASEWVGAKKAGEVEVQTAIMETTRLMMDTNTREEEHAKLITNTVAPAVSDLTRKFQEQTSQVDRLSEAIQKYANGLGQVVNSSGPDGTSNYFPKSTNWEMPKQAVDVQVTTDWPTVSRKVSEEQQQLELHGFRAGQ